MQHEDVTAVVWQDKRVVLLLYTNSDPRTDGSVTRKTGKGNEEIEIACPQAVINYTKHMGGVNVSDQKREYYGVGRSRLGNSCKTKARSVTSSLRSPTAF